MRFYAITILPAILVPVFAAVHLVAIKNFSFNPQVVFIDPGDVVIWTNGDRVDHTATADAGSFDSGPIAPGASFSHTFATVATLPYHCSIHPLMMGKIVMPVNATSSATVTTATATATATVTTATATATATVTTATATATATATVTTATAMTTATTTTTNKPSTTTSVPSSGNTLNIPIKAILSLGGGIAALAQFL